MVILICQFGTESNTFAPGRLQLHQLPGGGWFRAESVIKEFGGTRCYLGGALQAMEEEHGTPMPIDLTKMAAGPLMSDTCVEEVLDHVCGQIREKLGAFDGIYFAMHGGGACESHEDLEGYTLKRLRQVVGKDMPIFCSLDLHCNMTEAMVTLADALFVIKQVPHDDMYDTGYFAVKNLIAHLRGKCHPQMAYKKLPLLISSAIGCTLHGPCKKIKDHFASYCQSHGLLDCTFVHGFSSTDRPCSSASVLVLADGRTPEAEAGELAQYIWDMRHELIPESFTAEEAIEKALAQRKDGYVVINEASDNPGSGCPGDGTHLLREFLRQDLPGTIMGPIFDPEAAAYLHTFREGDRVSLTVGGKTAPIAGAPLVLEDVEIVKLLHCRFISKSPMNRGLVIDYGPTARVRKGNVEFLVVSRLMQVYDDGSFLACGADLKDYRLVGFKSMNHFRSFFKDHADAIVAADTPGLRPADLKKVPYEQVLRPIFPLDDI